MSIENIKNKVVNKLTKILFVDGIKCFACNKELNKDSKYCICDDCFNKLPYITGKICLKCGEPLNTLANYCLKCKNHVDRNFDIARSIFLYDGAIKTAIIKMKFYGNKYLSRYLSNFLYDEYVKSNIQSDIILPVPMTIKSYKKRGYNQTELLCKTFIDNGENVMFDCVKKIRQTENQVNLNFADRQENIKDAFYVPDKSLVKDKTCLIIDDIYTTGATVGSVAKALKKAGAYKVFVLTLCHEMPNKQETQN